MIRDFDNYKSKHLAFWQMDKTDSPLIGFTIGAGVDSWSYWQYNEAAQNLFKQETISAEDINPYDFVDDQQRYLESAAQIDDDICRTAIPLASIPWMEAILGCPVQSSGTSLKSKEILDSPTGLKTIDFDPQNPWIQTYLHFLTVYSQAFENRYPVGQSVIRGPSDLACALLGAEKATLALALEPDAMHWLLEYVTDQLEKFLHQQLPYIPMFQGGYVIGQYEIWAPQPVARIQEDFSVLYSPQLYNQFLKALDERLAAIAPYSLFHMHASSLFLIDHILEIRTVMAYQVSKDMGTATIEAMIPGLQKIQKAGKPLIVKGNFTDGELQLIKDNLSLSGLCLQPVVSGVEEAEQMLPRLRHMWR